MAKQTKKKTKKPMVWIEVPEIVVPDDLTIQDAAADLVVGVAEVFRANRELNRLGENIGSMLISKGGQDESGIIKLSDQYTEIAAAAARASHFAWLFAGVVQRERLVGRISGTPGIGLRFSGVKLEPAERKLPTAAESRQTMRATTKRDCAADVDTDGPVTFDNWYTCGRAAVRRLVAEDKAAKRKPAATQKTKRPVHKTVDAAMADGTLAGARKEGAK